MAEGFLDILGVDVLPSAVHAGDNVTIIVHTKNIGASDNFNVEMVGDFIDSSEFYLNTGLTKDVIFLFVMPDKDIFLTINTYHYEEKIGWVWDVTSRWDIDRWF